MNNKKINTKDLKLRSRDFNNELGHKIYRIKQVLDYFRENPERLEVNQEKVSDICNFYFGLRVNFQEKYGFDFAFEVDYGPVKKLEDSVYFPNGKVEVKNEHLKGYSNLHKLVIETRENLGDLK